MLPIVYEPADYMCVYNSCWRAPLKSSERKRKRKGPVVEQNKYTFFPLHSCHLPNDKNYVLEECFQVIFSVWFLMNFSKHMP